MGEAVPLPKKLGGDPITTFGLIYNQSGDAFYLEDNSGDRPWPVMQRWMLSRSRPRVRTA